MLHLYFVALIVVIVILRNFTKKKARFPPGPPRFPVIGSLLSVLWADSKDPSKAFLKLSKKYGPVVGLQMGAVPVVAICGHETVSRTILSEDLLSRVDESDAWLLEKTNSFPLGIIFSLPEFWTKTRGFTQRCLRKYGFDGKIESSGVILEQIVELCNGIKSQLKNGQGTLTITGLFNQTFFNIVWIIMTGNKYGSNNSQTQELEHLLLKYVHSSKFAGSIAQIYPGLVKIFPGLTGFNKLKKQCTDWRKSINGLIAEGRSTDEYLTSPRNFLEEFLQQVDKAPRPQNLLDTIYTDENIVAVFQDFTSAGTDTQSNLMNFLIRYLIQQPEIQDQLYDEVIQVVGPTRRVSVDDIPNLNYVQATLIELYRIVNPAPIVPRKLLRDWTLENYVIPKGTLVILNLWSADNDETVYKNPATFNPSRFLAKDGTFVNSEKLLNFGLGKRRCIGEQFAKTCLALTVATLIQKFSFHVDPNFGINLKDIFGMVRDTAPYKVLIKSRKPL